MSKTGTTLGVVASLLLATAAPSGADVLTANLVQNPGAEIGVSSTGGTVATIPYWSRDQLFGSPRSTVVDYGAPGFPTVAQGAALDGGAHFFAGGPTASGDDNGLPYQVAVIGQDLAIPAEVMNLVKSGGAQATISGCLGGYASQDDKVWMNFYPSTVDYSNNVAPITLIGPAAVERGRLTSLVPMSKTATVSPAATMLGIRLDFVRWSGTATYNDGYADNVSVRISTAGSIAPPPHCAPDASAAPGPAPPSGGAGTQGSATSSKGGTNSAVPLTRAGKRVVISLRRATAKLKLRCAARDAACKGTVSLTSSLGKLGPVTRFTIAAGRVGTVTVRLGRTIRHRLAAVSHKRFARLKITATARIGAERSRFTFGASH